MNRGYWQQVARWSLLTILAFELVLRIFVVKSAPREYRLEWGLIPVEGSYSLQGSEGYGVVHYFAHGEVETPHQGGRSIVVLGDSTTLAVQVDPSKNFVSLTETKLRNQGIDADLHNLGRSARVIADHVFLAPSVNEVFSPEVVILQVSPDSFTLSYDTSAENYFEEQGGGLGLHHQPPADVASLKRQNVLAASGLLDFASIRSWFVMDALEAQYPNWFSNPLDEQPGNGNAVAPLLGEEATDEQLQSLRLQIVEQVRVVRKAYPDSVIVFLVVPAQPKISYVERGLVWGNATDSQLVAVLNNIEGIHVVYPLNVFKKYFQDQQSLPRGSFNSAFNYGHLNPDGHRAVAQALTNALKEILR